MPSSLCAPLRTLLLAVIAPLLLLAGCTPAEPGVQEHRHHRHELWQDAAPYRPPRPERTLADFKGKVVTIFFGYTQCPDVCPTALSGMSTVMQELGPDAERVQVLFVTVDPERDTPELLAQYVPVFDARFLGLYGTPEKIAELAKEFRVFYRKSGDLAGHYTIDHTAGTYVFGPDGRPRLYVRHAEDPQVVVADIKALLAEK